MSIPKHWGFAALPIIVIGAGLAVAASYGTEYRGWAFLGVLILLAIELAVVGWLVNGRPIGAFVDNRNRISLSKLQAGAWTVVVLAALATAAIYNLLGQGDGTDVTDLNIAIPGELLLAMGISATSLVAAPALLSVKADQDPHNKSEARSQAADKLGVDNVGDNGKVVSKPNPEDASWADLFTGDEVGNAGSPDLGKIQQVLITILLLGAYAGYVYILMSSSQAPIHELPKLDESFVWLLGLSHAAYLTYKAAPHTQTAP